MHVFTHFGGLIICVFVSLRLFVLSFISTLHIDPLLSLRRQKMQVKEALSLMFLPNNGNASHVDPNRSITNI